MSESTPPLFSPLLLPALRARMGDRWYYVATMTFQNVADAVQPVEKIHERSALKTWIQRELRPDRKQQIVDYLTSQPERFFNALVLGVYGGEPEWRPIDVSAEVEDVEIEERSSTAFGLIHLSGHESMFAIDGQHRVEGIRAAVVADATLSGDEQCVVIIAHQKTDKGRERTRRLFSTLNGFARPVAESELVALSEDDAFALATRDLIDNCRQLRPGRVWQCSSAQRRDQLDRNLHALRRLVRSRNLLPAIRDNPYRTAARTGTSNRVLPPQQRRARIPDFRPSTYDPEDPKQRSRQENVSAAHALFRTRTASPLHVGSRRSWRSNTEVCGTVPSSELLASCSSMLSHSFVAVTSTRSTAGGKTPR